MIAATDPRPAQVPAEKNTMNASSSVMSWKRCSTLAGGELAFAGDHVIDLIRLVYGLFVGGVGR